jgi:hypothetical protein
MELRSAKSSEIWFKVFNRPFQCSALIRDQENEIFIKETVSIVILFYFFHHTALLYLAQLIKEPIHRKKTHKCILGVTKPVIICLVYPIYTSDKQLVAGANISTTCRTFDGTKMG